MPIKRHRYFFLVNATSPRKTSNTSQSTTPTYQSTTKQNFSDSPRHSSLSFTTHIKLIASKAKHRIMRLHTIYNQSYGPSATTMIRLYKTFVRPRFEYGHIATITASSKNINTWEGIQYRYINNILDLPHISKANVTKFGNLSFIKHRLIHLSKAWYNKAITHNTSIEHFVDNHVSKHPIRNKYKTPYTILITST